jgi:hypothetical protein
MDRFSDPDFAFRLFQGLIILVVVASVLMPRLRRHPSFVRIVAVVYGGAVVLAIALAVAWFVNRA